MLVCNCCSGVRFRVAELLTPTYWIHGIGMRLHVTNNTFPFAMHNCSNQKENKKHTRVTQERVTHFFFSSTTSLSKLFHFAACSSGCWWQIADSLHPISTIFQLSARVIEYQCVSSESVGHSKGTLCDCTIRVLYRGKFYMVQNLARYFIRSCKFGLRKFSVPKCQRYKYIIYI